MFILYVRFLLHEQNRAENKVIELDNKGRIFLVCSVGERPQWPIKGTNKGRKQKAKRR